MNHTKLFRRYQEVDDELNRIETATDQIVAILLLGVVGAVIGFCVGITL